MTHVLVALLALAAGWALCHRHHTRTRAVAAERAARPHNRRPAIEDAVAIELSTACCELWWTSCGTEHELSCGHHQSAA